MTRLIASLSFVLAAAVLLPLVLVASVSQAGPDGPAALIRAYWAAPDAATRSDIARRIATHPDYRPPRLSE